MKIEEYADKRGNVVLAAMIVNSDACAQVAAFWDRDLFPHRWGQIVGQLCVDHHEKHGRAPRRLIGEVFRNWAETKKRNPALVASVEAFLRPLCEQAGYDEERRKLSNTAWVMDTARAYFTAVAVKRQAEKALAAVAAGEETAALEAMDSLRRFEAADDGVVDLFGDPNVLKSALDPERRQDLIEFPGDSGDFYRLALARENLVSFVGPEKRGKTFHLIDMAVRALEQRRRTVFFEVGDMSKDEISARIASRLARHPFQSHGGWPCTVRVPTALINGGKAVNFEPVEYARPLSFERGWRAVEKFKDGCLKSQERYFTLFVRSTGTASVAWIKARLKSLARAGFVADVVCIDYADILAMPYSRMEQRDKINQTWMDLRGMAQEFRCLVATATQAKRTTYNRKEGELLTMEDISEDKRKLAQATGVIGINVTPEEKDMGITRLNWMALRERPYNPRKALWLAGNLALSNPNIVSSWCKGEHK